MNVRFQEEDLHCFRDAARDFNPLHLSEAYARRTPFGERVVYGALGFVACIGKLAPPADKSPSSVRIDFKAPLALAVDYTLQVKWAAAGDLQATLMDGSATTMRIRLQFREGRAELAEFPKAGVAPETAARPLAVADFQPGLAFRGSYAPGRAEYLRLLERFGVDRQGWGDALLLTVLCSSYLTGMELPGECAAYSGLKAQILRQSAGAPSNFEITLASFDERFGLAQSNFSLSGPAGPYAQGEIAAIARPPAGNNASLRRAAGTGRFAGKTAIVIGASRGLGASLALELAAEGGTVVGVYAQSGEAADEVTRAAGALPGRVIMQRGDASDQRWCCGLKDRIEGEFGRLDLLVCSAAPAILPLRIEPAYCERIETYLHKGFALVAAPLSALLGAVSAAEGGVLLISSSAIENPPGIWPHYAALKGAAEGLVRAAAADHPKVRFWIARPNKIETDLINTPLGRLDAERPSEAAERILRYTTGNATPGVVHFCG